MIFKEIGNMEDVGVTCHYFVWIISILSCLSSKSLA
jgi:hypothetical protein